MVADHQSTEEARYEAERCLSCGVCFECDNCLAACPEQAISRQAPPEGSGLPRYAADPDAVHGLRGLLRPVPVPRHHHAAGDNAGPARACAGPLRWPGP